MEERTLCKLLEGRGEEGHNTLQLLFYYKTRMRKRL